MRNHQGTSTGFMNAFCNMLISKVGNMLGTLVTGGGNGGCGGGSAVKTDPDHMRSMFVRTNMLPYQLRRTQARRPEN
jgi:hypothetical protein